MPATTIGDQRWVPDGTNEAGDRMYRRNRSAGAETAASEDYDATDGAVELAAEHDIDLSTVTGTGKDGRITKGDVEKLVSSD